MCTLFRKWRCGEANALEALQQGGVNYKVWLNALEMHTHAAQRIALSTPSGVCSKSWAACAHGQHVNHVNHVGPPGHVLCNFSVAVSARVLYGELMDM